MGQALPSKTGQRDIKIKCFRCGVAHQIKNCTERARCFKCNKYGDIASNCEQVEQNNKDDN